jgi:O-antigen ligase
LELYITNVQQILFGTFMFLSFLTLLIFLVKRKFLKALLGFLLPLLIYLLVNFIFESILYASESLQVVEELTREELTLRNIVLGIDE